MQLYISQFADTTLLDPTLLPTDVNYLNKIDYYVEYSLMSLSATSSSAAFTMNVIQPDLDNAAALHCDKWIEGTGSHMSLYAGSSSKPKIIHPTDTRLINKYYFAKNRNYSGDVSGLIGEALFSLVLRQIFDLNDIDFAHFGASTTTGIYPDFGITRISSKLGKSFLSAFHQNGVSVQKALLSHLDILPAEVKALASPDKESLKARIHKAVQQIRNFWKRRSSSNKSQTLTRGPSIIFLAIRNSDRMEYNGVIIWMI